MTRYPPDLSTHLAETVTTLCHCWRLTRADGLVLGFTDHDRTLSVDGVSYEPESGFGASEARQSLGMAADAQDVEGALSSDRIRDTDVASGLYDGATVETLLVNWREPGVFAVLRTAVMGKIVRGDHGFVAELQSRAEALDRPRGRCVSRRCDAELGDSRCGVALSQPQFAANGATVSVRRPDTLVVSGLDGFQAGWFEQGELRWTSGAMQGRRVRVSHHRIGLDGVVLSIEPSGLGEAAATDAFTIVAGCDKAFATCKAKFANALNFRGFPHLPGNDAAYGYVADGGVFDGGALVP